MIEYYIRSLKSVRYTPRDDDVIISRCLYKGALSALIKIVIQHNDESKVHAFVTIASTRAMSAISYVRRRVHRRAQVPLARCALLQRPQTVSRSLGEYTVRAVISDHRRHSTSSVAVTKIASLVKRLRPNLRLLLDAQTIGSRARQIDVSTKERSRNHVRRLLWEAASRFFRWRASKGRKKDLMIVLSFLLARLTTAPKVNDQCGGE